MGVLFSRFFLEIKVGLEAQTVSSAFKTIPVKALEAEMPVNLPPLYLDRLLIWWARANRASSPNSTKRSKENYRIA